MEWPDFKAIPWHQKLNDREKIYLPVILALVLLGFLKGCWMPASAGISGVKEKMALLESEKRLLSRGVGETTEGKIGGGVNLLRGNVVGRASEIREILKQVSDPNFRRGVEITKIDFAEWEKNEDLIRQPFHLQSVGGFFAVVQYMERLESLTPPLVIESFSMHSGDANIRQLSVTLKGSFYAKE